MQAHSDHGHQNTSGNPWYGYPEGYQTSHPTTTNNTVQFPMARPKNSAFISTPITEMSAQDLDRYPPMRGLHNPSGSAKPLKSAMKKPAQQAQPSSPGSASDQLISRARTISDAARARANSLSRNISREASQKHWTPGQLLVSFQGYNKIKIDSLIFQVTLDKIREQVLPMWPQGINSQSYTNERNELLVEFIGRPWGEKGTLGVIAMRMILALFWALGGQVHTTVPEDQVYLCHAAINAADPKDVPRLVFGLVGRKDPVVPFFLISVTERRRKLKLIDAPPQLATGLADAIKQAFPGRVTQATWQSDDSYKIEMRAADFDSISDLLTPGIFEYLAVCHGFRPTATIPLPQSSRFGITGRREVWIFRYQPQDIPVLLASSRSSSR